MIKKSERLKKEKSVLFAELSLLSELQRGENVKGIPFMAVLLIRDVIILRKCNISVEINNATRSHYTKTNDFVVNQHFKIDDFAEKG